MTADTLEKLEQKMRERANVLTEKGWLVAADLREFADTIAALRQQQGQEWPLWRNRWVDERTTQIRRDDVLVSYEMARAQAEYEANEYDEQFKAARERLAAAPEEG